MKPAIEDVINAFHTHHREVMAAMMDRKADLEQQKVDFAKATDALKAKLTELGLADQINWES